MNLQQHPLSAAFPAMNPEDFQSLKDSIGLIGVQNPITIFEGMVIDGWHRYSAANEMGMDCPSLELVAVDPRDFVLAQNKARRHVTQAQLAMATTAVYEWRPMGSNQHEGRVDIECPPSKSNAELSSISGVHINTIKQAKAVQAKGVPEVIAAVNSGAIGLPKAAAIAKLPKEDQAEAISKPAPKKVEPVEKVEPGVVAPPDYTELDAAHDQISELQADLVIARMGDIPEEEKQQAAGLIAELRAEIKTLTATLAAVQISRDSLMEERAQMLRQMKAQRSEIDRLKSNK